MSTNGVIVAEITYRYFLEWVEYQKHYYLWEVGKKHSIKEI